MKAIIFVCLLATTVLASATELPWAKPLEVHYLAFAKAVASDLRAGDRKMTKSRMAYQALMALENEPYMNHAGRHAFYAGISQKINGQYKELMMNLYRYLKGLPSHMTVAERNAWYLKNMALNEDFMYHSKEVVKHLQEDNIKLCRYHTDQCVQHFMKLVVQWLDVTE